MWTMREVGTEGEDAQAERTFEWRVVSMSEVASLKKQFIIEIDVIDGSVDYTNPDELSYVEVLGMIEFAKLMITREFLNEDD
ncbi:hypothetical protein [Paenibacillus alkalitolerans]|uniref:hypothetical protein n=1 Tax=Paenibacillus alkalitolerans TaxID=2799335 RepID=UPI0018F67FCC|nr:hypothetical protein [Paenibacillus alkalitolerans]